MLAFRQGAVINTPGCLFPLPSTACLSENSKLRLGRDCLFLVVDRPSYKSKLKSSVGVVDYKKWS